MVYVSRCDLFGADNQRVRCDVDDESPAVRLRRRCAARAADDDADFDRAADDADADQIARRRHDDETERRRERNDDAAAGRRSHDARLETLSDSHSST